MMRGRAALAAAVEYSLLLALGAAAPAAYAAEVKVMSTVALTPTLGDLTPKYESSSGNKLTIIYSTIADLKKRIDAGETADLMILSRPVLDELQTQGKVAQGSIVNVGRSYVAIGVRAGAPQPDISTLEKLKAALLATKSISYADPAKGGASGVYFAKVLDRLGIADQMKSKTVLVPNAQAGELVAKGEVEMDLAQGLGSCCRSGIYLPLTRLRRPRKGAAAPPVRVGPFQCRCPAPCRSSICPLT